MKWFIASDLHGSAVYCRRMLEAYRREGAHRLVLLGDILYHGPRNDLPEGYAPKEVIAALNPLRDEILCVRGNCDTEVDQMVLDFPILADYALLADGVLGYFQSDKAALELIQRNFRWPVIKEKFHTDTDSVWKSIMEDIRQSDELGGKDEAEVLKILYCLVAMCGTVAYSSIIRSEPEPIEKMKPVIFEIIRKSLRN